jgi:cyclase
MTRAKKIISGICGTALLAGMSLSLPAGIFISGSAGQAPAAAAKADIEKIGPNLAVIRLGDVATTVLWGASDVLVVDPGYEETGPALREAIRGLGGGVVKTIIDTHWHFDHTDGQKILGRGAAIISSEPTQKWLSSGQRLLGNDRPALPALARPNMTFAESGSIQGYPETVDVRVFPGGHTGGDLVVYFKKSKLLVIGDVVFSDMFPFVDVAHGGSPIVLAEVIQKIIDSYPSDVRIIPGHGRDLSMADLKAYRSMILATVGLVRAALAEGRSLEDIQKTDVLKDWKSWERGFTRNDWIGYIGASVKK